MMSAQPPPSGTSPLLPGLHGFGRTGLVRETSEQTPDWIRRNDVGPTAAIGDKSPPTGFARILYRVVTRSTDFIEGNRCLAYSEWLKIRLTKSRRARRRSEGSSGGRHILKLRRIYRFLHVPGPHQPSTGTAAPGWSWLPSRARAWLFPGRRSAVRLRKDGRTSD